MVDLDEMRGSPKLLGYIVWESQMSEISQLFTVKNGKVWTKVVD